MSGQNARYALVSVAAFVAVYAVAYRGFLGNYMLAYGDFSPFPFQATDAFNAFLSAWQPLSRGIVLPQSPILFLEGILILVSCGNPVIAQKVFLFSAMPIALVAMYLFLSRIITSRVSKLVASFVYSVNPATMGNFIGGATGTIFAQALFPLLLISLFDIRRDAIRTRSLLLLAFLTAAIFMFGGGTILLFLLAAVIVFFFQVLVEKGLKHSLMIVGMLFGSLLLFVALTLPLSYSVFGIATRFLPGARPAEALAIRLADVRAMYGLSTLPNVARLGAEDLYALGFVGSVWGLLGFILPVLAFFPLLLRYDRTRLKYVTTFSIAALSIIFFIYLTHLQVTLGLFEVVPLLLGFPNDSRLILMLALAYSPLIAITFDATLGKLCTVEARTVGARLASVRRSHLKGVFLCSIIIAALAGYSWPFFVGDMGFSAAGRPVERSVIPPVFYKVGTWLDGRRATEGYFRTLWLPFDYEPTELSLRWIDQDTLSLPLGSTQYVGSPMVGYITFVLNLLCSGRARHIGALLGPLNVKYLIVNGASPQSGEPRIITWYKTPYAVGDPTKFAAILSKQTDLKLVVSEPDFLVYENEEFVPHVFAHSGAVLVVTSGNRAPIQLMDVLYDGLGLSERNGLLVFERDLSSEQYRLLLNHSVALVLWDLSGEAYAKQASAMNASRNLVLVHSFLGFTVKNSGGPVALLFSQATNLVVAGKHAYYVGQNAKEYSGAGIPTILIENPDWTDKETDIWMAEQGLTRVPRTPTLEELVPFLARPARLERCVVAERDQVYRVGLGASGYGSASLVIDGKVVRLAEIESTFGWRESEPFYLSRGLHNLSVLLSGNLTIMEDIAVYYASGLPSEPLSSLQFRELSKTEYQVQLQSERPTLMVLGEPFDIEWTASTDREELRHFPAFGMLDGFYIESNRTTQVTIRFEGQKMKDLTVSVSVLSYAFLIAGMVYTSRKSIDFGFRRIRDASRKREDNLNAVLPQMARSSLRGSRESLGKTP